MCVSQQSPCPAANITYNGGTIAVPVALTEAKLLTNLQAVFTNGGEPTRIMVTPTNSVVVAAFASAAGRYRTIPGETSDGKTSGIVNVVNFYVSPFGEQKVEISRTLLAYNTLVYDPMQWAKCVLRPWSRQALAKTGDSTKQMIVSEQSLKHKNQLASGLIVEGVFARHPALKMVMLESGFTWLPSYLWRLHKFWRGVRMETPWVDRAPMEIVRSNIRFSLQPVDAPPDPTTLNRLFDHMQSDELLLFSTDYPHWQFDGDAVLPEAMSPELVRKIMIDNPHATYSRLKSTADPFAAKAPGGEFVEPGIP